MELLYVVVPIAFGIVLAALLAFRWAVRSGQMDDLDTPAIRMLHDDTEVTQPGSDRTGSATSEGQEDRS